MIDDSVGRVFVAQPLGNAAFAVIDGLPADFDVQCDCQTRGAFNRLRPLQDEFGLAWPFIRQDLAVVNSISHRVGVRYLGQIVEIGTLAQIFGNPAHQPEQRPTRVILRGIGEGHLEGDVSGPIRQRRPRG